MAKFSFSLQPALDKAQADERAAEQALTQARAELESALRRHEELKRELELLVQRIRREHDHLTDPQRRASGLEMLERDECLKALRVMQEAAQQAVQKQGGEVAFRRQRVELRLRELREAAGRTQALEKLKTAAKLEHQRALGQKLQDEIDEAGQQRAARRGPG